MSLKLVSKHTYSAMLSLFARHGIVTQRARSGVEWSGAHKPQRGGANVVIVVRSVLHSEHDLRFTCAEQNHGLVGK